ncbi:MAG: 50S ribosomal protein L23 [Candidatus Paceibacterota bacterium]
MALFSSKKKKDNETTAPVAKKATEEKAVTPAPVLTRSGKPAQRVDNSLHHVLIEPHITEKATYLTDDGVYTFVVAEKANKLQIKQAVKDIYGVTVRKVRTVTLPKKSVQSRRGKPGTKGGLKKAYVYLKEGDSIELM